MILSLKGMARRNEDADWVGFLDRQARVEGTIEVPGTFRLDGYARGRILSRQSLVLGPAAQVEGEIEGDTVLIFGRFRGTLRASERVEIHEGAEVSGDLYTPCLVLEPRARFEGHCYLNPPGALADPLQVPVRTLPRHEPAPD